MLSRKHCATRQPLGQRKLRTSPFNAEAAADAIAQLRILLEASDGDAEESFRSLQDAVAGAVEKQHLDDLSASINDFDFDAALVKLDEIAERCARNGDDSMNQADQKKTVLLVDDAPANIQIVNSILKDLYKIRIATSGAKALELAKSYTSA